MHATGHSVEPAHPTAKKYVAIAVVLAVVTLVEVGAYYVDAMRPVLTPTLLVLSATKFALVAMFYMHLKFDHRLFSALFVGGLLLAGSIIIALIALSPGLLVEAGKVMPPSSPGAH